MNFSIERAVPVSKSWFTLYIHSSKYDSIKTRFVYHLLLFNFQLIKSKCPDFFDRISYPINLSHLSLSHMNRAIVRKFYFLIETVKF